MGESIVARLFSRLGAALAALVFSATTASALVTAPAFLSPSGAPQGATGVICLNLDGTSCTFGGGGGGGGAITAAANSFATGFSVDFGKLGDAACSTDNGAACDLIQLVMRTNQNITNFAARFPATLGIKTAANSLSVAPASDASFAVNGTFWQATQPVSGSVTANAGTNLNTSALALDATVVAMSAKLPAVLGSTTKAGSLSVTFASDQTLPAFAATPTFNIGTGGPSGYTLEAGHIATVDTSTALLAVPFTAGNPIVCNATASMTGTTQTSLCAAPGANLHNYITQIVCGNSSATVGTFIDVEDGSGGTVLAAIPAGISYQGGTLTFPLPGLRQPTANTALFLVNETTGAAVKCSAVGYKGS